MLWPSANIPQYAQDKVFNYIIFEVMIIQIGLFAET
jgi:hypothetical protein